MLLALQKKRQLEYRTSLHNRKAAWLEMLFERFACCQGCRVFLEYQNILCLGFLAKENNRIKENVACGKILRLH